MPRVKTAVTNKKRHKKVLKLAKGYWGAKSKLYRIANQQVMRSMLYAFLDRRNKKRDFRRLCITLIDAAARMNGLSYNRFIQGLKHAGVEINRKMLADLAVRDEKAFGQLVEVAKANLSK